MNHVGFLLVGFLSGLLSGSIGVGGAVISTPLIRAMGVSPYFAIASTLPAIFPSAITGSVQYQRAKLIRWDVVTRTVPVGIAFAVVAAWATPHIPGKGHLQMIVTAAILFYVAFKMAQPDREEHEHEPHRFIAPGIGTLAGTLSGLLGVGGGTITVPGFRYWLRMPLKVAVATSLVCVGLFAIPSTITHAIEGRIDWSVAIAIAIGVIPGAYVGSKSALRVRDGSLRIFIAFVLGAIAIIYGVFETIALFNS